MATPTLASLLDLSGKTALVSGGSRGWGLQMAHVLGAAGARVVLAARTPDTLELACAGLQAEGIDARWVAADCRSAPGVDRLVTETLHRVGDVDILVNSAGATQAAAHPAGAALAQAHAHGYDLLSQAIASRSMVARGTGRIIHLAPWADTPARVAVLALTQSLAAAWARQHLTVNALCPAAQADLRGACLFFASAAGQHCTGQCLAVHAPLPR